MVMDCAFYEVWTKWLNIMKPSFHLEKTVTIHMHSTEMMFIYKLEETQA
jgi:hypothetical protein